MPSDDSSSLIRSAQITALYLFDVAESIDLTRLSSLLRVSVEPAHLASKPAIPSYVRYLTPPLQVDGEALGFGELDGFHVRVKIFDYGVVSLSLVRPFAGTWAELIAAAHRLSGESSL